MRQIGMSVGAVLLAAGMAVGQSALGDGRALDRNMQVGGPGVPGVNEPTRDYLAEFRFRNALVTGNVPGGASFRGDAGYGLNFDFRERVGSDDLFSFRRDSFTSGLAGTGIRGTEALQYQFALTVGNELPRNLRGSLLASRTGERVTYSLPTNPIDTGVSGVGGVDVRQATPQELGEYEPGTALSLRSISSYTAGRSLGPSMLLMAEGPEGLTRGMVASPLRGIAQEELQGDSERTGRRPGDPPLRERGADGQGEARTDPTPGLSASGDVRERLAMDYAARVSGAEAPASEPGMTPEAQGEAAVGSTDPFLKQLADLQQVLREGVLAEPGGTPMEGDQGVPGAGVPDAPASQQAMADRISGWKELVVTLRQGVGTVEVPVPKLDRASAYDLHVDQGKAMMTAGRFFEAEQRFTMALAARPGDPIASIGRVHAQIGAGLDLSASVNLRSFMVEHPEFVGARYEPAMLPSEDRLEIASRRLSTLVNDEEAIRRVRESALLLAYVSFHRGDRVSTILGLERLGEGPAGQRDPLAPLLRAVWLDDTGEARAKPSGGTDGESDGR